MTYIGWVWPKVVADVEASCWIASLPMFVNLYGALKPSTDVEASWWMASLQTFVGVLAEFKARWRAARIRRPAVRDCLILAGVL